MRLTEKQIEIISAIAAQEALKHLESEKQKQEKVKRDNRLRNIKLLLRNYRLFSLHAEEIIVEVQEMNALLDLDELETDEFAIESIVRSKKRTFAMIRFINKMLQVYKVLCEQSNNPEDIRSYETVWALYISEQKKTVKEIATCQNVDPRTVYRDIDRACESLSSLIFGVDSIRFI